MNDITQQMQYIQLEQPKFIPQNLILPQPQQAKKQPKKSLQLQKKNQPSVVYSQTSKSM